MKFFIFIWSFLACIPWNNLMCQYPVNPDGKPEITSLSPYFSALQHNYDVKFYYIDLEISNTSTYIQGQTRIMVESLTENIDTLAFELSSSLIIDSVLVNSIPIASIVFSDNLLKIVLPEELKQLRHLTASIYYRGNAGTGGFYGGVRSGKEHKYDKWVTFTLSEPYQSHTWFPCKQDLADKADSAWIFLTVDNHLKAGSNGLLTKQTPVGNDKTRYEWKTRYPVCYYLISFSVADYIDYTFYVNIPGTSHNMPVQNFLYNHPSVLQAEKEKIDKTKDILLLYSELLGTYPFYLEKYGHCLAPMGGGMEHQTMTTLTHFNFSLVAHELAHQWFGNYVTCKTWQDIWINEGFASYLEYVAIEKLRTEEEAKAWMGQAQSSSVLFPEGSVFIDKEDVRKVDRIFSMELSYKKGAIILHMLRFEIADDSLFFSILKGFLAEYASGVASGNDFINYVNHITGLDYTWFLNQWYYGKGYPVFFTAWSQTQDSLIINSIQEGSSTETPFFRTHMEYKLVYEDGSQERIRVNYLKNEERFAVNTGKTIDYIAPDPDNVILKSSVVIKQMDANKLFEVNPNPFTDTLNLRFKNPNEKRMIRLSSLSGKIIFESESRNALFSKDLTSLIPGVYILTITEGMKDSTVKLVKTNPKK